MTVKRKALSASPTTHRRAMDALATMTPEERRQTLVAAGIVTRSGKIAKVYRTEQTLSYRYPTGGRRED